VSDRAAFLRAIRESPDDDGPRLGYADWMEERGAEYLGEFVKTHCQYSRLKQGNRFVGSLDIRDRAVLLFGRHADLWLPKLAGLALWCKKQNGFTACFRERQDGSGESLDILFHRGLGENVICSAADWLTCGDELCAWHPVRVVQITRDTDAGRVADMMLSRTWKIGPVTSGRTMAEVFHAEWPSVEKWHMPTSAGVTAGIFRNAGTYEHPDWAPIPPAGPPHPAGG
jgi:uncharacterized protein (TIGR02996 family)